jgi:hypothetical protein
VQKRHKPVMQSVIYPRRVMRFFFLFFVFLPLLANAQKVETKSFTIQLPDELKVQNDNLRRVLAFGPNMMPFVSIEYGEKIGEQFDIISKEVSQKLLSLDSELTQVDCGNDCLGKMGSAISNSDGNTFYVYYYLVKSEKINFIVSVASPILIEKGQLEVNNIAKQLLSSGK